MYSRKNKWIAFWLITALIISLVTGCSKPAANEPAEQPATVEAPAEQPAAAQEESKPMAMIAGSASSGGANYLIMSGWAEIINKNTKHKITVEATGGPGSNIELIGNGDAQIGVVAMSIALPAINGTGWAEGKDFSNLRSMFGVHDALMDGLALKDKGINSIYDLNGKVVSLGPAGGTPALAVPDIFKYLKIEPKYVNLGQEDSINALKDGQIDAAIFFGGVPRPAFQEIAASHEVTQLVLSAEEVDKLIKELPQYSKGTIAAGTYSYMKEDITAIKDRYAFAVSKDIPEQVVYEIVKATLDNMNDFKKVHKSLDKLETGEKLLDGIALPMHPGAIKAFEEIGVTIPDYLIPPEMK